MIRDQGEGGDGNGLQDGPDEVQATFGCECFQDRIPIERDGDRGEHEIQRAADLFHRGGIAGIDDLVRAKAERFIAFRVAGGECVNFAAPLVEKLERHVPQAADADDSDPCRRFHLALHDRIENGDPAAEKRAAGVRADRLREGNGPNPVTPHAIGKAAVALDDGCLAVRAEIVVAAEAMRAGHAAPGHPPKADAIADFDAFHLRAGGDDFADHFVAGNEWIGALAPLVVDHRKVGVADAAVAYCDLDLLLAERTGIKFDAFKGRTFGGCSVGGDDGTHR